MGTILVDPKLNLLGRSARKFPVLERKRNDLLFALPMSNG